MMVSHTNMAVCKYLGSNSANLCPIPYIGPTIPQAANTIFIACSFPVSMSMKPTRVQYNKHVHTMAKTIKPSSHPKAFTNLNRTKHRRQTAVREMQRKTMATIKMDSLRPLNSVMLEYCRGPNSWYRRALPVGTTSST